MKSACNKVIILGAGASKSVGIPTIKDFFNEGAQAALENKWDMLWALDEFCKYRWGTKLFTRLDGGCYPLRHVIEAGESTDIEIMLDEAAEAVKKGVLRKQVLEGMKSFIFRTISESGYEQEPIAYRQLIEQEIRPHRGYPTIISFNYDTILEQAMERATRSKFSYNLSKCERASFKSYEKEYTGDFDYLKLHGSMNWLRCPDCQKFRLHFAIRYKEKPYLGLCQGCKTKYEHVLVPPGKNKAGYIDVIRRLWDKAEYRLKQADELIVIGYSFRKTDNSAIDLFSKTIGDRKKADFDLTIADINPASIVSSLCDIGVKKSALNNAKIFNSFEHFVE